MGPRLSRLALALFAASAWGCPAQDDTRPEPPTVDATDGTTSRTEVLLTGAAEAGATVAVSREPAFAPDFELPTTLADATTARWSVRVPLLPRRVNTFRVTAVDRGGLASDPAVVEITHRSAFARRLTVALDESRPRTGDDGTVTVRARAQVEMNQPGTPADGWLVAFRIENYVQTLAAHEARTDAAGVAVSTFVLERAGSGRLVAELLDVEVPTDSVRFEVLPGVPVSATLELFAVVGTQPVRGTEITVAAGTQVGSRIALSDAGTNTVSAPWLLSASPGGVHVAGGQLVPTQAGDYVVRLIVPEAPEIDVSATLHVTPSLPSEASRRLVIDLAGAAVAGVPTPFAATLMDPWGNTFAPTGLALSFSNPDGVGWDAQAGTINFTRAGRVTVTASALSGNGDERLEAPATEIQISPNVPSSVSLTIGGQDSSLGAPLLVEGNTQHTVDTLVTDAFGNPVAGAVRVTADAGATLFGRTLTAPTRPGVYVVQGVLTATGTGALGAIRVEASAADHLVTSCPASVAAGVTFVCTASVRDAAGNPIDGDVQWLADPEEGASINGNRIVLRTAGEISLRAALVGSSIVDDALVQVSPAIADAFRTSLSNPSVAVGGSTTVLGELVDAFGNEVPATLSVSTDAPGAMVAGSVIGNLRGVGQWNVAVVARSARGEALDDVATLTVTPGPASRLQLEVSPTRATTGQNIVVRARLVDAGENETTGSTTITLDGRRPDGLTSILSGELLRVFQPGAHLIEATDGTRSARQWIDVLPAADVTAPQVTAVLDATPPLGSSVPLYHPGGSVGVGVLAFDHGGLRDVQIRISSPQLGEICSETRDANGETLLEAEVACPMPVGNLGDLVVAVTARDLAGTTSDASPLAAGLDDHFDRFQFAGPNAVLASARTVSLDASLRSPSHAQLDARGKLVVLSSPTNGDPGGQVLELADFGRTSLLWDLGSPQSVAGLAPTSLEGGMAFVGVSRSPGERSLVERLRPGAGPQAYTTPPLEEEADEELLGLVGSGQSGAALLYGAVGGKAPDGESALWSLAIDASASIDATAVGPAEPAQRLGLAGYRPVAVCRPKDSAPDILTFSGYRIVGPGDVKVGLYTVALDAGRLIPGVPSTLIEANQIAGPALRVPGPCVELADGSVLAGFWADVAGTPTAGLVVTVRADCANACEFGGLLAGRSGEPMGDIAGLALDGNALLITEGSAGRVSRVSGLLPSQQ